MHTHYLSTEKHSNISLITHSIIKLNIVLLLKSQNEEIENKKIKEVTITSVSNQKKLRSRKFLNKDTCNDIDESYYYKYIELTAASASSWSSSNRSNCESQRKWSNFERSQLRELRELRYNKRIKWKDISIQLDRSHESCRVQYYKRVKSIVSSDFSLTLSNHSQSQEKWWNAESFQIYELRHNKSMKWKNISRKLNKSISSCWESHHTHIESSNRREKWLNVESSELYKLRHESMKWRSIDKQLNKSKNCCRCRYESKWIKRWRDFQIQRFQ